MTDELHEMLELLFATKKSVVRRADLESLVVIGHSTVKIWRNPEITWTLDSIFLSYFVEYIDDYVTENLKT